MLPEIVKENVDYEDLVGNFYYPENKTNVPPILIVSGSEGGISTPDIVAGILASKGYAAMASACFEMPGLP